MKKISLTELALQRPVTVIMLSISMVALGVIAWFSMPLMFMPRFDSPFMFCSIPYPSASPKQVEQQIAIPVEGEFRTIPGLTRIRTISDSEGCFVTMMFDLDVDMTVASAEVRDRIERLKLKLPDEVENILLQRFSSRSLPVMALGVFKGGDQKEFVHYVRNVLSPRLRRLDGVADIRIMTPILEDEILVEFEQDELRSMNLGLAEVVTALQQSSLNIAVGELADGSSKNYVRLIGEYRDLQDLENIIVTPNGLRLKDVASVTRKARTIDAFVSLDGKGGAFLMITKESEANTVETCKNIHAELAKIMDLPVFKDTEYKIFFDQSELITTALKNLLQEGLYGAAMAIAVLFLFLHRVLPTIIVALTIPCSLVIGLVFMFFMDMTLNLVSLVSMIIVVGMLVDNAIVVVENIIRHRQMGHTPYDSARLGASEVGLAIFASTATTWVVFMPMFFLDTGEMSVIMKELGYPLIISLAGSLVLALTLIPLAMSRLQMKQNTDFFGSLESHFNKGGNSETTLSRLFSVLGKIRPVHWVIETYAFVLNRVLRNRFASVACIGFLIYITIQYPYQAMGMRDMPKLDTREVKIEVFTNQEMTFEKTRTLFESIEASVREHMDVGIKNILTFYELGGGEITLFLKTAEDGPEWSSPEYKTEEVMKMVSTWVPDTVPGANIHVSMPEANAGGNDGGIELRLRGDDTDVLEDIGDRFKTVMAQIENLADVDTDVEDNRDEIRIRIDEPLANQAGVTPEAIARTVDWALRGARLPFMKQGGREIPVWAQYREEDRKSKSNLDNLTIQSPILQKLVPLNQLVDDEKGKTPMSIHRVNGKNVVTLQARAETTNMSQIASDLKESADNFMLPPGYSFQFGESLEELGKNIVNFTATLIMAIVLIYLVMSALFESFLLPFSILTSVPLALGGAIWVLFFMETEMDTVTFIGCVLMAGIIVNNGIVIVDHINTMRKEIPDRNAAIVQAGVHRFRPVMMTALTTILGLVPLAMAKTGGAATFAGLGQALIGGLTVGTMLTLVVVPLFYTMIEDAKNWVYTYVVNLTHMFGLKSSA